MRDDDLAPLLEDYFRSGAAQADLEVVMAQNERQTLMDRLLDEHIDYGGFIMTRRAVLAQMQAEGFSARAIDFFVFHPQALQVEQVQEAEEEWSDPDDRFITPTIDLDAHNNALLDELYPEKGKQGRE